MKNAVCILYFFLVAYSQILSQWHQSDGLFGANIFSIISKNNDLFIASGDGGVFKSTDSGKSWVEKNKGINNLSVTILAINDTVLVAGTSEGIISSTDNGENWLRIGPFFDYAYVHSLIVDKGVIFAGVGDSFYTSTDNGKTWLEKNNGFATNLEIDNIIVLENNIVVGSNYGNGPYVSTDRGDSWIQIEGDIKNKEILSSCKFGNKMLVEEYGFVYLSSDSGKTWARKTDESLDGRILSFAEKGDTLFAGTEMNIAYSIDTGKTWSYFNNGLKKTYINSLLVFGNKIFAGLSNFGVMVADFDSSFWQQSNNGINGLYITKIIASGNKIFTGTLNEGLFVSTNEGFSWDKIEVDYKNMNIFALAIKDQKIYVISDSGLYLSFDFGKTWELKSKLPISHLPVELFLVGDTVFLYADLSYPFNMSLDVGATWIHKVMPGNSMVNKFSYFNGKIFAGMNDGIQISTDYGDSWSYVPDIDKNCHVYTFFSNNNKIYAGSSMGVLVSTDSGSKWSVISEPGDVTALTAFGESILAVYNNKGVLVSNDNATKWLWRNDGLTTFKLTDIITTDNYCVLGTQFSSIFRTEKNEIVSVLNEEELCNEIHISPNPATDFIIITLPSDAHTLKGVVEGVRLYDVFGQVYPTPALPASREGVRIDVSSLPAGVYFVRVGEKVSKFVKVGL